MIWGEPRRPSWVEYWLAAWRAPRAARTDDVIRNCAVVYGGRLIAGAQWRAPKGAA